MPASLLQELSSRTNFKMKKISLFYMLCLVVGLYFIFAKFNIFYPKIGHDYRYFMPYLMAGKTHLFYQGFHAFRWTGHACGGMVVLGNPQGMYYSITQILTLFTTMWSSIQIGYLFYYLLGYIGWYLFAGEYLKLKSDWRHALALVMTMNGFIFSHLMVGHMTFQTFPLIGFLAYLFFSPKKDSITDLVRRMAYTGLLAGIILYSGGYIVLIHVAILFGVWTVIDLTLPWVYGVVTRAKILSMRAFLFLLVALCIGASKIVAVLSFMNNVPRTMYFERLDSFYTAGSYILQAMFRIPQTPDVLHGIGFLAHERTALISPIVALGCVFLLPVVIITCRRLNVRYRRIIPAQIIFLLVAFFLIRLVQGNGFPIQYFEQLPFIKSIHVPFRFIFLWTVVCSCLGIWALDKAFSNNPRLGRSTAVFGVIMTIATFAQFYSTPLLVKYNVSHSYDAILSLEQSSYISKPYTAISYNYDTHNGNSDLECYEPLFDSSVRPNAILSSGFIKEITNGYYNFMNPACYSYPDENNCKPGSKIHASDPNIDPFISHKATSWKISGIQKIADILSITTLFILIVLGLLLGFNKGIRRCKQLQ